jgi:hypothetical protein
MSEPHASGPLEDWPAATLGPVRRLRVLAAALPGVALVERVLPVPYERAWAFLSDIANVARYDPAVPWVKVLRREGERLRVLAGPVLFRARLTEGFVWMQAPGRLYVVGQAVEPAPGDATHLAHLEGVPAPGGWLFANAVRRHVLHDVERIARCLAP